VSGGESVPDGGLGSLLLFARSAKLTAFRDRSLAVLAEKFARLEEVDRHLQLLPLKQQH
jgi:hypothetical protein